MHGNLILTSANVFVSGVTVGGVSVQQLTGLPLGTSAGGELATKVLVVGGSGGTVTNVPKGAANLATGQVASSTTAGTLVAARATRRSVTVTNSDSTINIYIGPATVTAGNGFLLKPGQSVNIDTTALIQHIAASGAPTTSFVETFDT